MITDDMQNAVDNVLEDLIDFSRSEVELILAEVIKVKLVVGPAPGPVADIGGN